MKRLFTYSFTLILLYGCDREECKNTNPVFEKYSVDSKEYTNELVDHIEKTGKENLDYHVIKYLKKDGKEYMQIWLQDNALCAQALFDITGNKRLENFRKVKGMSYQGAGLSGLDYDIIKNDSGYTFIFKNVNRIVD